MQKAKLSMASHTQFDLIQIFLLTFQTNNNQILPATKNKLEQKLNKTKNTNITALSEDHTLL